MTAPTTHEVILNPPQPNYTDDPKEMYKYLYEIWKRTGGYSSNVTDLKNLNASVTELNTLVGVRTDETVQAQFDLKANAADLGEMAFQDKNNVEITGGSIITTSFEVGSIQNSAITNSSVTIPIGSTSEAAQVGATLHTDTTTVGNSGASETDLMSYLLKATSLNTDKSYLELSAWGTYAANANNKTIKLKIGSTTIYDTTSVAANDGAWSITAKLIRTAAGSAKSIVEMIAQSALVTKKVEYTAISEDFTTDLTIVVTGQGSSDDDIKQEGLIIKWQQSL